MRRQATKRLLLPSAAIMAAFLATLAYSHCQIPCGIYNDQMRFDMITEHITTIEKAMNQITELSAQPKPNMNQIVRWVGNKDEHADEMSEIITYYFMAQRIKPAGENDATAYKQYIMQLTLLHEMLIYATKAKQTTDLANIEKLRALLAKFHDVYFAKTGVSG
jgi:nickel superoxide dismutase